MQETIFTRTAFIKSYPEYKLLKITPAQRDLLELVTSYQLANQTFFMSYRAIAATIFVGYKTVKVLVHSLTQKGYLIANTEKNYNGTAGGSKTILKINKDLILSDIATVLEANKDSLAEVAPLIECGNDAIVEPAKSSAENDILVTPAPIELTGQNHIEEDEHSNLIDETCYSNIITNKLEPTDRVVRLFKFDSHQMDEVLEKLDITAEQKKMVKEYKKASMITTSHLIQALADLNIDCEIEEVRRY